MTTTVQKWGNSQGISLPKFLLDDLDIQEGEEFEIVVKERSILLKPIHKTMQPSRKTIQELFSEYKGDYQPEEVDWGKPQGEELW